MIYQLPVSRRPCGNKSSKGVACTHKTNTKHRKCTETVSASVSKMTTWSYAALNHATFKRCCKHSDVVKYDQQKRGENILHISLCRHDCNWRFLTVSGRHHKNEIKGAWTTENQRLNFFFLKTGDLCNETRKRKTSSGVCCSINIQKDNGNQCCDLK